ncbi:MAG: rRNA maturation RNase YbeY, partial [Candidatus Eremiobacteraeota bacterium]|nr:rRNA maturation RNase YbeY [Candidatus Eremiobacteraeota bacterium]
MSCGIRLYRKLFGHMPIHYRNEVRGSGVDARALRRTMQSLLSAVDEKNSSISVTLVDDPTIQGINREHRGKDKPTDVLSFPLNPEDLGAAESLKGSAPPAARPPKGPPKLLGDIVISIDTARRQAADYDAPLQLEIYRLLIHGLLHVLGHDHMEPEERAAMESEERRLAAAIEMPWP